MNQSCFQYVTFAIKLRSSEIESKIYNYISIKLFSKTIISDNIIFFFSLNEDQRLIIIEKSFYKRKTITKKYTSMVD